MKPNDQEWMRYAVSRIAVLLMVVVPSIGFPGDPKDPNPTPTPTPTPVPSNCDEEKWDCPQRKWLKYKLCWDGTPFCPGEFIVFQDEDKTPPYTLNGKLSFSEVAGEPCPTAPPYEMSVSPEFVPTDHEGALDVTVVVTFYCCGYGPHEILENTETFQVTVDVIGPGSEFFNCGCHEPDFAEWICNTYDPEPDGFSYTTPGPPTVSFRNDHQFSFLRVGSGGSSIPQGVGRFGSERLLVRHQVRIFSGSQELWSSPWEYYAGVDENGNTIYHSHLFFYETGAIIECGPTCEGQRAVIGDTYYFNISALDEQMFIDLYCVNRTPGINDSFTFEARQEWLFQRIYIDRDLYPSSGGSQGKVVGGPWTSRVIITYDMRPPSNLPILPDSCS